MEKIYYKHMIVKSTDQDKAEKAINDYIEDSKELGEINIISLNVIPERIGVIAVEGHCIPTYWYHISLVYTQTSNL